MSSRARRKAVSVYAAVLVAGVGTLCLLVVKIQERQEFIGNMDQKSGFRCRFTLASSWKRDGTTSLSGLQSGGSRDLFTPPENPLWEWINRRMLHKSSPSPFETYYLDAIANSFGDDSHLVEGYPEFTAKSTDVHTHHLRIDGYPATLVSDTYPQLMYLRRTALLVYAPDHGPIFEVVTYADDSHVDEADQEMKAVVASFHVEKVVPKGGKQ